ncbi:hypothetical protein HD806DRAFT_90361 [Xylariaceae sp. AK1471]|nr:hypothetical protein HD806DRAFT_90361 [Xylariaceae sp. AK1471]
MSFFSSTSKIVNASPIPSSVRKSDAVALLHDHEFFLLCDPHHASHKTLPQPPETEKDPSNIDAARKHFKLPSSLTPADPHSDNGSGPVVKVYEVVDHMPNPVWSSNVVSQEEFVDHGDGAWVRIRSPMGVVMETNWSVREKEGDADGELELVEDVEINCSRLVMGIVKGQVENNWKGIHKQIIDKLVKDAETTAAGGAAATAV